MDVSFLVVVWIIILVAENILNKNKKKSPPPTEGAKNGGNISTSIPTLANDPNFPDEDVVIFQDEQKAAEVREVGFTELYRQRKAKVMEDVPARKVESNLAEEKKSSLPLNLTAESAMNAIVLSEILGKPKALRRR